LTKDLANLFKVMRTIDDINQEIDKVKRYLDFDYEDHWERTSHDAYTNKLNYLLTIRHALEKKREKLESS